MSPLCSCALTHPDNITQLLWIWTGQRHEWDQNSKIPIKRGRLSVKGFTQKKATQEKQRLVPLHTYYRGFLPCFQKTRPGNACCAQSNKYAAQEAAPCWFLKSVLFLAVPPPDIYRHDHIDTQRAHHVHQSTTTRHIAHWYTHMASCQKPATTTTTTIIKNGSSQIEHVHTSTYPKSKAERTRQERGGHEYRVSCFPATKPAR